MSWCVLRIIYKCISDKELIYYIYLRNIIMKCFMQKVHVLNILCKMFGVCKRYGFWVRDSLVLDFHMTKVEKRFVMYI